MESWACGAGRRHEEAPEWNYDYACLMAHDATPGGTLTAAWKGLDASTHRSFWEGANVYVGSPWRNLRSQDILAMVSDRMLLQGAWYSLEQAGILLDSAVTLYKGGRPGSQAVAASLAMLGREELGKYRMLMGFHGDAQRTRRLPSVKDVQDAIESHVKKQMEALLSWSVAAEPGQQIDAAIRTQLRSTPQDPAYQQADQVIQSAKKAWSRREPDARDKSRKAGLYVDLDDAGQTWKRPAEQIKAAEAEKLLSDAINDYAAQHDKMSNLEMLRAVDPNLARDLEAWPERGELPAPPFL